jgi:hypothetical protein
MDISPAWLDGYFAAIVVAPRMSPSSAWVGRLLNGAHDFPDHARLQRFLDLVMLRYNTATTCQRRSKSRPMGGSKVCQLGDRELTLGHGAGLGTRASQIAGVCRGALA